MLISIHLYTQDLFRLYSCLRLGRAVLDHSGSGNAVKCYQHHAKRIGSEIGPSHPPHCDAIFGKQNYGFSICFSSGTDTKHPWGNVEWDVASRHRWLSTWLRLTGDGVFKTAGPKNSSHIIWPSQLPPNNKPMPSVHDSSKKCLTPTQSNDQANLWTSGRCQSYDGEKSRTPLGGNQHVNPGLLMQCLVGLSLNS